MNLAGQPCLCLLSSVPTTLWTFYRPLMAALRRAGFDVEIVCSAGEETQFLRDELGLVVHEVLLPRAITPLRDALAIARLTRLFRRRRYDIVHAHTPKAVLLGMMAATLARVPHRISTLHGLPLETERGLKRRILTVAERLSLGLSQRVLVVSPSLHNGVVAKGLVRPEKLAILGHGSALGVDLHRFSPDAQTRESIRHKLDISPRDVVAGFVGRLVRDKGVDFMADSFTRLFDDRPNLRLLVVGDFEPHRGALLDRTRDFIRSNPKVIYVPHSQVVHEYYAAMDLLVLPTAREGFGCVLLEAAAMGIPTVANRVTGCVDAVADGVSGILVPPGDGRAFDAAVLKLVDDEERRYTMGRSARDRAAKLFDSELLIEQHVALYRELLASNKAP